MPDDYRAKARADARRLMSGGRDEEAANVLLESLERQWTEEMQRHANGPEGDMEWDTYRQTRWESSRFRVMLGVSGMMRRPPRV